MCLRLLLKVSLFVLLQLGSFNLQSQIEFSLLEHVFRKIPDSGHKRALHKQTSVYLPTEHTTFNFGLVLPIQVRVRQGLELIENVWHS